MDEPNGDNNSDSDSCESWTVVNKKSNEQPQPSNPVKGKKEDDTDTDGVSVISEDDADISDKINDNREKEDPPNYQDEKIDIPNHDMNHTIHKCKKKYFTNDSDTPSVCGSEAELPDDYISSTKIRSYIHKRNNKIGGVLDTILIITVITTTCIAVGHLMGTNEDCSSNMYPWSQLVNKVKELQEENGNLRLKIKLLESKNLELNRLSQAYYQLDTNKTFQYYTDINPNDGLNKFINQEKEACNCIKVHDGDMIPENITEAANPQINEISSNNVLDDVPSNMNITNIFLSQTSESLNSVKLEQIENINNKKFKKPLRKRSIPSYHVHNFADPKSFDDSLKKEDSNLRNKNKNSYNPENNGLYVNKKQLKEKKKQEKYIKESLDNSNIYYGKFKKEKKYKMGPYMEDNEKFKSNDRKFKDESVLNYSDKSKVKFYKDSRKEKYKMKGYKYNKDENLHFKNHKTRDEKKESFVKEKKYLKV